MCPYRSPVIDPVGATIHGSDACVDAGRGFFESFPDYRNVFDDVAGAEDGIVAVRGRFQEGECDRG